MPSSTVMDSVLWDVPSTWKSCDEYTERLIAWLLAIILGFEN